MGDIAKVFSVTVAPSRSNREDTFVDAVAPIEGAAFSFERLLSPSDRNMGSGSSIIYGFHNFRKCDLS